MRVDPTLLDSGGQTSRHAAQRVRGGAERFAGVSVAAGIFGDFDRARGFGGAVEQCQGGHVESMRGESTTLDRVGGNASKAAWLWVKSEEQRADAMRSLRPQ